MRIISLIALFILTSCIHDNGGSERGPLFPSSRKATKSQTNNDASIENPASARCQIKLISLRNLVLNLTVRSSSPRTLYILHMTITA